MKKIFVTGLAVLTVVGISIPVIASNAWKGDIRVEGSMEETEDIQDIKIDEAAGRGTADVTQLGAETKTEPSAAVEPEMNADINVTEPAPDVDTMDWVCSYYVDANGDGICDHCAGNGSNGVCSQYVDANGDGVCDHCAGNGSNGVCSQYVDANGDGVCDHCAGNGSNGVCSQYVDANGDGVCDHCAGNNSHGSCAQYVDANGDGICDHCTGTAAPAGNGTCGSYVDANGDGVCDHCTEGYGNRQQNQGGHHGRGHHGGGRHCR